MTRIALRVILAVGLLGTGWVAAKAQSSAPIFELQIDAPVGQTQIRCVRGCRLAWVERGVNPNSSPITTFEYGCNGAARCQSGRLGGWID